MAEIDIALGILGSASALYGFSVAYYVFARGLQDLERARIWQSHREWRKPETEDEANAGVRKIEWRRAALNGFLIASMCSFAVSLLGELTYIGNPQPVYFQWGVTGFSVLASGVVAWFLVVGVANLIGASRDMPPKARRSN